ncbi:MAG: DoxX family protein [Rhodocyclaceae bacterium]|nr:DoxX family protein [Rhodocyclaceae bacterium]MBX3668594.1 DoxX family protein [Rhodocyclaceae bacterium]
MEYAFQTTRTPARRGALDRIHAVVRGVIEQTRYLSPLVDVAIRLLVAYVFFRSGLTKIASWDSTIALFENEYSVPLLPPAIAALLGTAAELSLPVFLTLGLATRFAAAALFVFNIVAVISYPDLGEVGLMQHQYWGLFMLVMVVHGPGKLSLDHLIARAFAKRT